MGTYDTFIDGDISIQLKCFTCELKIYHVGDGVPYDGSVDIVILRATPSRVSIRNGIFVGFDKSPSSDTLIDKWGNKLESEDDAEDFISRFIRELMEKRRMTFNPQSLEDKFEG